MIPDFGTIFTSKQSAWLPIGFPQIKNAEISDSFCNKMVSSTVTFLKSNLLGVKIGKSDDLVCILICGMSTV